MFERDGMLLAADPARGLGVDEPLVETSACYRTVGDMSRTGAVPSEAATLEDVVAEITMTRVMERGQTRADDRASEATSASTTPPGRRTCGARPTSPHSWPTPAARR